MTSPSRAGRYDIADIVRAHRGELETSQWVSSWQRRVLTDIAQCRTEALGGHLEMCTGCDFQQPVYRSCRNRHCPKCQALAQENWIEQQRNRMLDVKHTWTRELQYHPHIHTIVTAGGLSNDGKRFLHCAPSYLFPILAMAKVFRAKLIDALWKAYNSGSFDGFHDFEDPEAFAHLINLLPRVWVVYAKPSFDRGEHVLQYLGRYTHRVGISNSRLLNVTSEAVTFRTRGADSTTILPVEFLRRFIRHVLPHGFHKIRHVGLNASSVKRNAARALLNQSSDPTRVLTWQQRLQQVTGRDVCQCPLCHKPLLSLPLHTQSRAPPIAPKRAAA